MGRRISLKNLALVALAFVAGCGSDRDLQDQRNEKLQEQLTQTNLAAGTYRGNLLDKNGKLIAELKILLSVFTKIVPPASDLPVADQQVVVKGEMTLYRDHQSTISFPEGAFNTLSGNLQATMTVQHPGLNTSDTLQLLSKIQGDTLTGSLAVDGYSENYSGTFVLKKNAGPGTGELSAIIQPQSPDPQTYISLPQFESGVGDESLLILPQQLTNDEDFIDPLLPIKTFTMTIVKAGQTTNSFPNASFDQRRNRFYGSITSKLADGETGTSDLDCTAHEYLTNVPGLQCKYRQFRSKSVLIAFSLAEQGE